MSDQPVLMNISETSPYLNGICDLKCDYSFYYQLSICTVYPNSGNKLLNFTYETNSNGTKQVLYNGIEYNVSGIFIVSSSTHFFDGNIAEAEIIINHSPVLGNGLPLSVCIPITSSLGSIPNSKGTKLLSEMIGFGTERIIVTNAVETDLNNEISGVDNQISSMKNEMSSMSNEISQLESELPRTRVGRDNTQKSSIQNDESTITRNEMSLQNKLSSITDQFNDILNQPEVLNIRDYTLEFVIPRGPFFSYTDTTENVNYIVYGMTYAIFVEPNIIQQLQNVVVPFYNNPTYNTDGSNNPFPLFLNQTGATNLLTTNLSDEIYIDCQPTGSSNEQTNITTSTSNEPPKNSVMFLIYVIFFIFVLLLIYMLFAYITHPDKKNFSVGSVKNPFT